MVTHLIQEKMTHNKYLSFANHILVQQNYYQSSLAQQRCYHQPLRCLPFQCQMKTKLLTNQMTPFYRLKLVVPKAHNLLRSTLGQWKRLPLAALE